jgi:hypothetical protein
VLHGQREQVVQVDSLSPFMVALLVKAGEDLVLPLLAEPGLGRGVGKLLELPAHAAHVGGRAHDDGVGRGQRDPSCLGQVALGIDGERAAALAPSATAWAMRWVWP